MSLPSHPRPPLPSNKSLCKEARDVWGRALKITITGQPGLSYHNIAKTRQRQAPGMQLSSRICSCFQLPPLFSRSCSRLPSSHLMLCLLYMTFDFSARGPSLFYAFPALIPGFDPVISHAEGGTSASASAVILNPFLFHHMHVTTRCGAPTVCPTLFWASGTQVYKVEKFLFSGSSWVINRRDVNRREVINGVSGQLNSRKTSQRRWYLRDVKAPAMKQCGGRD